MIFPQNACPEREQEILNQVKAGNYKCSWSTLTAVHKQHTAEFYVFSDALIIPLEMESGVIKDVRVNVSAKTQQDIADLLGCSLLTTKLADMMWTQKNITLPPYPMSITSSTTGMIKHSNSIDTQLANLEYSMGLVCTVGKHWVLDNDTLLHSGKACNYGWHFEGRSFQGITGEICCGMMKDKSGQYVRLIQGRGWAHDPHHVDYSQICVLVMKSCLVDGSYMQIDQVASDPELSYLLNYSGILKVLRQVV